MKLLRIIFLLPLACLVNAPSESHAQEAYVFYPQGIQGGATGGGVEGASEVVGYFHETIVPFDPASGRVSGAPMHAPIHFTKLVDTASPSLLQASMQGQLLQQLEFEFRRTAPTGTQETYYTILAEEVLVTRVSTFLANPDELGVLPMPETPVLGSLALETVSLIYGRITWRHADGTEFSDDWRENSLGKTEDGQLPTEIATSVFPNPFNTMATLTVDLAVASGDSPVEVTIYDALGREVQRTVLDTGISTKRYVWDATDATGQQVPSGLYFYRVRAGDVHATGGMTLIK